MTTSKKNIEDQSSLAEISPWSEGLSSTALGEERGRSAASVTRFQRSWISRCAVVTQRMKDGDERPKGSLTLFDILSGLGELLSLLFLGLRERFVLAELVELSGVRRWRCRIPEMACSSAS
jgi:hypothetical protein